MLRQARALAKHYRVVVVGFGADPFRPDERERIQWFPLDWSGSAVRWRQAKQWLYLRLGRLFPRCHELWYRQQHYWRYAWHFVQSARYRLILCNDVDTLPLGIAATRWNRSCKVVLDMHEYATREQDDGHEWLKVRRPLVTGIMRSMARRAHGTVTVSEAFVKLFQKEFGMKKPIVVHNAPDLIELPAKPAATDGKIHLIHHGGACRQRRMERMIEAMRHCGDRFVLHFMLSGGEPDYREFLEKAAAELPPGRVVFEAPVPPDRVVAAVARHDIGVYLLPDDNFNCRHAMPNKFFDFIVAGLPVAIGPSPAMAAVVKEHRIGWVGPDFSAESFGALLAGLTDAQIAACRQASLLARQKFNAATETAKLVELVKKLVPPGESSAASTAAATSPATGTGTGTANAIAA